MKAYLEIVELEDVVTASTGGGGADTNCTIPLQPVDTSQECDEGTE